MVQLFGLSLLFLSALTAQTAKMVIRPSLITQCNSNGLGRAKIAWAVTPAAPVQVRVGGPSGTSMTGPVAASGEAETGDWITGGLAFVLVDAGGSELARVTAQVQCSARPDPVATALGSSPYFPLQVGNVWVYRINSRVVTSSYVMRRVVRTETIGGKIWFVVADGSVETHYRTDDLGRVYQLDFSGAEKLWLDPTATPDPSATLKVQYKGIPYRGALGSFADSLGYQNFGGLIIETGTFVRGIGLVSNSGDMITGSSGGFTSGLDLVWARVGANLRFGAPATGVELSVESTDLDLSGGGVTNCAVPCYFTACGIAPGADPAGTFKPCFQSGVRLHDPSPFESGRVVVFDLLDSNGTAVFHVTQQVTAGGEQEDGVIYQQIPLYSAPNVPVPLGAYRLRATISTVDGQTGAAEANLRVR